MSWAGLRDLRVQREIGIAYSRSDPIVQAHRDLKGGIMYEDAIARAKFDDMCVQADPFGLSWGEINDDPSDAEIDWVDADRLLIEEFLG